MKKRILFIEDDEKYLLVIKEILEKTDYDVDMALTSYDGIELSKKRKYDLYLIDLYLDDFQGVQVGEIIRMNNEDAIIVYISNSNDDTDELRCLKMGGTDFISKNSSIEIFLERLRKALDNKKENTKEEKIFKSSFESLEVDLRKRLVKKNGEYVHLTNTEISILTLLFENKNEILSREKIIEEIWQIPFNEATIEPRTIDTHIKNIKKKLQIKSIISVRGIGYRWYEK